MNSGLKGAVFVLPYFIVKYLSDPLEIPPSRLLGPYETSFGPLTQQIINQ